MINANLEAQHDRAVAELMSRVESFLKAPTEYPHTELVTALNDLALIRVQIAMDLEQSLEKMQEKYKKGLL